MKERNPVSISILFLFVFIFIAGAVPSQAQQIRPVTLQQPMPDFTLPVYQGGEITFFQLKGKNVLLIFPRGLAGQDHWCHVCNYQYADLAAIEKSQMIREKYNVEILFVLPYSREMVEDWEAKFSNQMADLEKWKNPEDPDRLDEGGKRRMAMAKMYFPKSFIFEKGKVPLPLPILIDADQKVSKGLGMFTTEWSGSKIEQNVPTIYIIDKEGVVQFKYMSQNTLDRPSSEYLLKVLSLLK